MKIFGAAKMKLKITFTLLAMFQASAAQAALSCNVSEGLPTGFNHVYQPGTLFGWTFQCSGADPQYIDYQWAPPLDQFMRNPHAFITLWQSAPISGVAMTLCFPGQCDPGQQVHYQSQVVINPNPCQIIGRHKLGKNLKMNRNPALLAKGVRHFETCAQPPVITPPGTPIGTPPMPEPGQCGGGGGSGGVSGVGPSVTGHPVNLATGSMWHQQTDFLVKGRTSQTNLEITRTYAANAAVYAGGFGPNWRHNYETVLQRISIPQSEFFDIVWIDENGGPYFFLRNEDGTYTAPEGSRLVLTESTEHFEIKKPDRTIYRFGKSVGGRFGLLTKITERHGESLDFAHDDRGRLVTVSTPFAGSITFSYNDENLITEIHRDRDNLSYFYTYFENGRLASATDFQGRIHSFSYVQKGVSAYSEGMLETITDPIGRVLKFTYDENGRARQQYEPGGGVWNFSYAEGKTTVVAPNGAVTRYFFDENFRETKRIFPDGAIVYSRWENGFRTNSCPEFGGATKYGYDQNGNIASIQRPEDSSPTTTTYNQEFNTPMFVQPTAGAPIHYSIDPNTGDLIGVARGSASLTFTRDQFGNLLSTNNGRTSYADQRDSNGLLTTVFDLHNPEVRFYDSRGRVSQRQFQSGRVLTYNYNDDDQEVSLQDTHGPTIQNSYDLMKRLVKREVSSGGQKQITAYDYDTKDRLVSVTDALGRKTEFSYHQVKIREKPISSKDPAGRITYFEYDSKDRLVKRIGPDGGVVSFTYDQRDNLTSITDALGNVTSYAYDRNDRKIRETRPSVAGTTPVYKTQQFFYDAGDKIVRELVISATGGENRSVNYEYDPLDQMVRKVVQRESSSSVVVDDVSEFSYENQIDTSLLKSAVNGVTGLHFQNEAAPPFKVSSFLQQATQPNNPLGLVEGEFEITRDSTGQIHRVQNDGNVLFTAVNDPAGRLLSTSRDAFSTSISYDGFGRKQIVQHSDGKTGSFQYDLLNRLLNVNWTGSHNIAVGLAYDLAGNVNALTRENASYQMTYDEVGQLLTSTSTGSPTYNRVWVYDLLGNRVQDSANGAGVFVNNFLTANNAFSLLADATGFGETVQISSGTATTKLFYRGDGLTSGVESGSVQTAYFYDALGRRVAKQINQQRQNFVQSFVHLGVEDRILLGKAGDGTTTTYLDGHGIDEHLGEYSNGAGKGYITDHLGSVLNGAPAGAANSFGHFGESADVSITSSSPAVHYGFTGREYDSESGFNYHRARLYSPRIGRWLSQDPTGYEGDDSNFYRYVGNVPINRKDPTGTWSWVGAGIVVVIVGGMLYVHRGKVANACNTVWKGTVAAAKAVGGALGALIDRALSAFYSCDSQKAAYQKCIQEAGHSLNKILACDGKYYDAKENCGF